MLQRLRRADFQFKALCFKLFFPPGLSQPRATPAGHTQRSGAKWAGGGYSRRTIAARTTIEAKRPKLKQFRGLPVFVGPN